MILFNLFYPTGVMHCYGSGSFLIRLILRVPFWQMLHFSDTQNRTRTYQYALHFLVTSKKFFHEKN